MSKAKKTRKRGGLRNPEFAAIAAQLRETASYAISPVFKGELRRELWDALQTEKSMSSSQRIWQRGDKANATINGAVLPALILEAVPPSDGIAGLAKVKIAMKGLGDQLIIAVHDKPVSFSRLSGRESRIDGLDFE